MSEKQLSAPMQLLWLVWGNRCKATGHSWNRINRSMRAALNLAIDAGMEFYVHDFALMAESFNIGYWFGDTNGEGFYTLAVATSNDSAARAFENWKGRGPLIGDDVRYLNHGRSGRYRRRLAVGAQFSYAGFTVDATSFSIGGSLTACTYKPRAEGEYSRKIARRYSITRADLIRDWAERKTPAAAAGKAECS